MVVKMAEGMIREDTGEMDMVDMVEMIIMVIMAMVAMDLREEEMVQEVLVGKVMIPEKVHHHRQRAKSCSLPVTFVVDES
jgi:hypothetical protein